LDRQAEEIVVAENDGWDGIDWQPLWDARRETVADHSLVQNMDVQKTWLNDCYNTGSIWRQRKSILSFLA
jgi:hypothetical protein